MLRKLLIVVALILTTAAAVPAPAPAIDFICSCLVCKGGTGPACRAPNTFPQDCAHWWAAHSSECH